MDIKEEVYLTASRYGCADNKLDRVWAIIRQWDFPDDKDDFYSDVLYAVSMVEE